MRPAFLAVTPILIAVRLEFYGVVRSQVGEQKVGLGPLGLEHPLGDSFRFRIFLLRTFAYDGSQWTVIDRDGDFTA